MIAFLACVWTLVAGAAGAAELSSFERFAMYHVAGTVAELNEKYVLLKAGKKFRIVPRHAVADGAQLRPGRFAVAHLTAKDIASVQKLQKARRLPR